MSRKLLLAASLLTLAGAVPLASFPAFAAPPDMKVIDLDNDGTVSLDEAKAAAEIKFTSLDTDKDGTLDKKEATGGGVKKGLFKKIDGDKDGTVDKAEYTAKVEEMFKKADKDNDGTLDAKELAKGPGKKLVEMIQ